jgi:hypothetical protein
MTTWCNSLPYVGSDSFLNVFSFNASASDDRDGQPWPGRGPTSRRVGSLSLTVRVGGRGGACHRHSRTEDRLWLWLDGARLSLRGSLSAVPRIRHGRRHSQRLLGSVGKRGGARASSTGGRAVARPSPTRGRTRGRTRGWARGRTRGWTRGRTRARSTHSARPSLLPSADGQLLQKCADSVAHANATGNEIQLYHNALYCALGTDQERSGTNSVLMALASQPACSAACARTLGPAG